MNENSPTMNEGFVVMNEGSPLPVAPESALVSLHRDVAVLKQNVADLEKSLAAQTASSTLTSEEIRYLRDHVLMNEVAGRERTGTDEVFGSVVEESEQRKSVDARNIFLSSEQDNGEDEANALLPKDTFSFIVQGKPCSATFACALAVFAIQAFTFVVLLDLLGKGGGEGYEGVAEFFDFPPNVDGDVRACQVVALLITVLSEDNIMNSLNTWDIGFDREALIAADFDVVSMWWWNVSVCLRFFGGLLAVCATFVLIMQTDNARDVLLNFTAVQFVSLLDDAAYVLAELGFLGKAIKNGTIKTESATTTKDGSRKWSSLLYLPTTVAIFTSLWLYFSWRQANGDYLCERIFVQFGDEVADLAHFSGIYQREKGARWSGKVAYVERPHLVRAGVATDESDFRYSPARFGYCTEEGAWVFAHGDDRQSEPELCDWQMRSLETSSFDITTTSSEEWFAKKEFLEVPTDRFYLACFDCADDSEFCGAHGDCERNQCVCHDGWYGLRCEFPVPCDGMIVDTASNDFPLTDNPFRGEFTWPEIYNLLEGVSLYNRPVYIGEGRTQIIDLENFDNLNSFQSEPVDVIIFNSGRRWELVLGADISEEAQGLSVDDDELFAADFHSFWSTYKASVQSDASDVDTATDSATPQGLRWNSLLSAYTTEVDPVLTCKGLVTDDNIRDVIKRLRQEPVAVAKLYGNISEWDTSNVRDMSGLFWKRSFPGFNGNISLWDLSEVTDTSGMFYEADKFNQDISSWTVSSVGDMSYMFYAAKSFNHSLAPWDTFPVTSMNAMFLKAEAFDQDISGWDTASVRDMSYMFSGALSFNQDVNDWNTASVTTMSRMFDQAASFNGNLSDWDTSFVTTMQFMFSGAQSFNRDISNWKTSSVANMRFMFSRASSFHQDLSRWDTSLVESMRGMFAFAPLFNSNLSNWNVSSVTDMENMFRNATSFNQTLCWNLRAGVNTSGMFCGSGGGFEPTCVDDEDVLRESQRC